MPALSSPGAKTAAAIIIMTGVTLIRKSGCMERLPKPVIPWVTVLLGTLMSVAGALVYGEDVQAAAVYGAMAGVGAVGAWETVGKSGRAVHRAAKNRRRKV